MGRLFGTDGVRGVANLELTCELAYNLGRAGAFVLAGDCQRKPRILVGRDTRISGDMLAYSLMAGICSVGAQAIDVGIMTSPGVAYLTRTMQVDAGVVISASHNPVKDNGIKFFSHDGFKLSDAIQDRIESILLDFAEPLPAPIGENVGGIEQEFGSHELYIDHCARLLHTSAHGLGVVLDCANGAASAIAPEVFARVGCKVFAIHAAPDGLNINHDCGSTHPQSLQEAVVAHGAAVGFAFDGDADRLIVVDEKGCLVDGDQTMAISAIHLKRQGKLKNNTVVATVMSNLGLEIALKKHDISLLRTDVGDRYVLEAMLAQGMSLGGEQSGHIIHLEDGTTGDGIVSAIHLLSILLQSKKSISTLAECMKPLPQTLVNIVVPNAAKYTLLEDPRILSLIEQVERSMQGNGRVLVRASGTEPLVRVMLEGSSEQIIEQHAKCFVELVKEMGY